MGAPGGTREEYQMAMAIMAHTESDTVFFSSISQDSTIPLEHHVDLVTGKDRE